MLEWMGKKKVVNHHNDVPFHVLERKWSWNAVSDGVTRRDAAGTGTEAVWGAPPRPASDGDCNI